MCIHEALVYEVHSGPLFCELRAASPGPPSSSEDRVCGARARILQHLWAKCRGPLAESKQSPNDISGIHRFSVSFPLTCSGDQTYRLHKGPTASVHLQAPLAF